MKRLSEITNSDYVYFVLRRPAFVTNERVYRVSLKAYQTRGYHQVTRGFGKVLLHDQVGQEIKVQPSFSESVMANHPEFPVVIPYWAIQKLLWWNGAWTDTSKKFVAEGTSTMFNRFKQAFMRRRETDVEQKAGRPPLRTFEEVTLWI